MKKVLGCEIGKELIEALNLRPDVTSIGFKVKADKLVEVTTTHDMESDEAEKLASILSKYNLAPKE